MAVCWALRLQEKRSPGMAQPCSSSSIKVASIWVLGDIVSLREQPQEPEQYYDWARTPACRDSGMALAIQSTNTRNRFDSNR